VDFDAYIQQSVVKILTLTGEVNGTGFWVLGGYCVTCAHLIQDERGNLLPNLNLEYKDKQFTASYRADLSNPEEDIAVFKVKGEQVQCVPLGEAVLDTEVRAYGYRKGFPKGYPVTGRLRPGPDLPRVGKLYNLETSQPDQSSIGGMSGCPIYDPERMVVVGILYGEEQTGPSISYVHPIEKVYKHWPSLKVENTGVSKTLKVKQARSGEISKEGLSTPLSASQASQLPLYVVPPPVLDPVGRDREIEKVFEALKSGTSAVITGIAGVGKTTVLAFAIRKIADIESNPYTDLYYHRIAERDSEGERLNRLLVSLMSCLDPHAEVKFENSTAGFAQARRLMAGRRVLLAVDNVDDSESQNVVEKVRQELPSLTLAVTSRQVVWRNLAMIRVKGISESDGVKLFQKTYENVLGNQDEQTVALLCKRVQGHPMMITHLALEARESGLSPEDLNANLPSLNVDRDLARRFDSIRNRLSEDCHRVLKVIGLLDTATLRIDLVEQVAQVSVRDLDLLEDQHLIRFHPDRRHFTVHELVRTWCCNRLDDTGEDIQKKDKLEYLRTRIAEFYQQFLKKRRPGKSEDLAEIDNEWPNILGLIDNLSDPNLVLTLVGEAIGDHFDDPNGYVPRRGQTGSLLSRGERLLNLASEVDGLLAAKIEKNLGHFYYWRADYDKAEALFHRARDRYKAEKDVAGEIASTWLLGYLADDENRYREAQVLFERGTELAEQVKPYEPELMAVGHHLIGCTLYHQGRFEEAETVFRRARGLIERGTAPHLLARIDRRLGSVALKLGRMEEAEKTLCRVAGLVEQLRRPRDAARIARHLGILHLLRGDLQKAEEALQQAWKGFNEIHALRGIGYTSHALAILQRKQGRLKEAKELCDKSLHTAREAKSLYGEAAAYEELANILETEGAPAKEINRHRQRACNIYTVIGHQRAKDLTRHLQEIGAMEPQLPKDIQGILFDLMDTLAYLKPGIYDETQRHFASCLGVSAERFEWAWTNSRKDASTGIFKTTEARMSWVIRTLDVSVADETLRHMVEEEERMWRNNVQLYDETIPLLETLRSLGLHLAIITNGPVAMACLNQTLGLSSLVDVFVLSSEAGVLKPDPFIYTRALGMLKLHASQCVFVGDGNDHELDGARQVGLDTIKIKQSRRPYKNLKNESLDWDLEVNDLAVLRSLFQSKTKASMS